ncbi:MAG: S8 family serine peptidase, partial [bacterium]
MKIKLLIVLSLLLQSPQLFPADSYIYNGERVTLEARKDKLAVILSNNFSENNVRATLQNFFSSQVEIKKASENVFLINFTVPGTDAEIDNYLNSLNQRAGEIKFASKVYYGSSKKVSQIVTDKFIVRLRNSSDTEKLNILNVQNNCSVVSTFKDGKSFLLISNADIAKNALDLSAIYLASGIFEYAEPDFIYPEGCLLLSVPNDPLFSTQWGLKNTGQLLSTGSTFLLQGDFPTVTGIPGSDMNVDRAWDITTGSPNVKIGVIDSGIDSSHIDLQAPGHLLPGYDAFTNTNSSAVDFFNHGTSTAGLIGAVQNNSIGISGVAPNCALMSICIFDINGNTSNSIIERAFDTAVARGIDVLSNSWGGGTPSQTITDAIDNAAINGRNGLGCIIFFGSGNDGNNPPVYPSVLPNVICVGASTPHDQKKAAGTGNQFFWGSNYGSDNIGDLDLVAPTNCQTLSSGNAFEPNFWGTSATCPNAAGVAGLILSVNTAQSRQQVISNLLKGCDKIDNVPYPATKP